MNIRLTNVRHQSLLTNSNRKHSMLTQTWGSSPTSWPRWVSFQKVHFTAQTYNAFHWILIQPILKSNKFSIYRKHENAIELSSTVPHEHSGSIKRPSAAVRWRPEIVSTCKTKNELHTHKYTHTERRSATTNFLHKFNKSCSRNQSLQTISLPAHNRRPSKVATATATAETTTTHNQRYNNNNLQTTYFLSRRCFVSKCSSTCCHLTADIEWRAEGGVRRRRTARRASLLTAWQLLAQFTNLRTNCANPKIATSPNVALPATSSDSGGSNVFAHVASCKLLVLYKCSKHMYVCVCMCSAN